MKSLVFILIIVYFFANPTFSQSALLFEEEDLSFILVDNVFRVQGIYHFKSEAEKNYTIKYPFPIDTIYSRPYNISIRDLSSGDSLVYKMNKNGSSLLFSTIVKNKTAILISYSQKLYSNKAKYILLTTNTWEKALKRVDYKLITDPDMQIKKFSIEPDKELILEGKKLFIWQRENFMPNRDFEFEF